MILPITIIAPILSRYNNYHINIPHCVNSILHMYRNTEGLTHSTLTCSDTNNYSTQEYKYNILNMIIPIKLLSLHEGW